MSYTAEQRRMINLGIRLSQGLPQKVRRSLLEAMATESSFHNYGYGDRDSEGVLQQRPSTGWGPASESAKRDIKQYLEHAMSAFKGFHGTAGQLAQTVQGSAFPDRYDTHRAEVKALLRGQGGGGAPGMGFTPGGVTHTKGGFDFAASQQQGLQALISGDYDPMEALGDLLAGFQPGSTVGKGINIGDVGRGAGGAPVVGIAKKMLGQPYVWGGESLKEGGFDCSGLIYWAYKKIGVSLPRTAAEQLAYGKAISFKQLRPGDLVGARDGHHIVMYIGHGKVIAAPHTGTDVQIQPLSYFSGSDWRAVRVPRR